jgi:NADPH-dependent 7-cyano-7-deazaguanine reductase QueF
METAAPPTPDGLARPSQDARPRGPLPTLATLDSPPSLTSQTLLVHQLAKLGPSTGRPDRFDIVVTYTPTAGRCVELGSLVRYLEAYHAVPVSAEALADQVTAAVLEATGANRVEVTVHQTGREAAALHVTARHPHDDLKAAWRRLVAITAEVTQLTLRQVAEVVRELVPTAAMLYLAIRYPDTVEGQDRWMVSHLCDETGRRIELGGEVEDQLVDGLNDLLADLAALADVKELGLIDLRPDPPSFTQSDSE